MIHQDLAFKDPRDFQAPATSPKASTPALEHPCNLDAPVSSNPEPCTLQAQVPVPTDPLPTHLITKTYSMSTPLPQASQSLYLRAPVPVSAVRCKRPVQHVWRDARQRRRGRSQGRGVWFTEMVSLCVSETLAVAQMTDSRRFDVHDDRVLTTAPDGATATRVETL